MKRPSCTRRYKPTGDRRGGAFVGALIGVVALCVASAAEAHFILLAPDSWMSQDTLGLPEKLGPCGDEGGGTPTGAVTVFHSGQTIPVTIDEVITHPGHYRVALAVNSRDELPAEPKVTRTAADPCASAAIEDPPTFPILADNQLPHTEPFLGPQTLWITLPADVTCAKCTLQVLEFMSSHSAPCFYHHCADIAIEGPIETPTASPPRPATTTPTTTPTPVVCIGDCSGTSLVAIDNLVTLMNIALSDAAPSACANGVPNGLNVDVALIIRAVHNALNGCP